jgi:hypothetical protein
VAGPVGASRFVARRFHPTGTVAQPAASQPVSKNHRHAGHGENRLVKVSSDAGIRITAVVSDAHGVAATAIIDCLLAGGTPEQAPTHAGRLQAPPATLLAALQGELSAEHLFVAKTIRNHLHYLEAQLADLESGTPPAVRSARGRNTLGDPFRGGAECVARGFPRGFGFFEGPMHQHVTNGPAGEGRRNMLQRVAADDTAQM